MDFLKNILERLKVNKTKNFRSQVQEEKKQKYLFRDEITKKHTSSRNGFIGKKKRSFSKYFHVFQSEIGYMHDRVRESRMLGYMGGFLLFLSLYIIIFSPYFKISPNKVLIESDTPGIDINIAYRSLEDIYGKSIFMLDEESIAYSLKKNLRNIAHIRIETLYPNGVKVLITGSPIKYLATITGVDKRFGMSENGVLVPASSVGSGSLDTIEINSDILRSEPFLTYKQVISDNTMLLLEKIHAIFREEWSDLVLGKTRYFYAENELHLSLESGTKIILSLQSDTSSSFTDTLTYVKNELVTLKGFINSHRKELLDGSIGYIDARINRKLFVCRDPDICKQNLILVYGKIYAE